MKKSKSVNSPGTVMHMLHRASQLADGCFETANRNVGLTARQLVVMDVIARLGKPCQTDVCEATGIDRSTLADIVRRLAGRRLITRRRNRLDARANQLCLTDEGRRLLEDALAHAKEAERVMLGVLGETKRADFVALLQLLLNEWQTRTAR